MWDVKSPRLTETVPHSKEGERKVGVSVAGKETGKITTPSDIHLNAEGAHPSAGEPHIVMPSPTIKPLLATIAFVIPFIGLIWHKHVAIMVIGGLLFLITMTAWLLTPIESEH
jgi:hypothetical protein